LALVETIESGMTLRAAAAAHNVAPATAHRCWRRYQAASLDELRSGAWLRDRSSHPHRQPRHLSSDQDEPILRARRETGLGPGRLAGIVRRARSTIWNVFHSDAEARVGRRALVVELRRALTRPGILRSLLQPATPAQLAG